MVRQSCNLSLSSVFISFQQRLNNWTITPSLPSLVCGENLVGNHFYWLSLMALARKVWKVRWGFVKYPLSTSDTGSSPGGRGRSPPIGTPRHSQHTLPRQFGKWKLKLSQWWKVCLILWNFILYWEISPSYPENCPLKTITADWIILGN